jgi:hypothetical protein
MIESEGQMDMNRPSAAEEPERIGDEREAALDEREAALDERELLAAVRDAEIDARAEQASIVMAAAERRNVSADARDGVADERQRAASLDAFVYPNDQHDAAIKARRFSANDRSESKPDRSSSAEDRSKLSDVPFGVLAFDDCGVGPRFANGVERPAEEEDGVSSAVFSLRGKNRAPLRRRAMRKAATKLTLSGSRVVSLRSARPNSAAQNFAGGCRVDDRRAGLAAPCVAVYRRTAVE